MARSYTNVTLSAGVSLSHLQTNLTYFSSPFLIRQFLPDSHGCRLLANHRSWDQLGSLITPVTPRQTTRLPTTNAVKINRREYDVNTCLGTICHGSNWSVASCFQMGICSIWLLIDFSSVCCSLSSWLSRGDRCVGSLLQAAASFLSHVFRNLMFDFRRFALYAETCQSSFSSIFWRLAIDLSNAHIST